MIPLTNFYIYFKIFLKHKYLSRQKIDVKDIHVGNFTLIILLFLEMSEIVEHSRKRDTTLHVRTKHTELQHLKLFLEIIY